MHLIKEKLEIEEELKKKIKNVLMFLNVKETLQNGYIINIPKTNIAYIEPHKLVIGNTTLFFNECENVYTNSLDTYISLKELHDHIKNYRSL